jgi:hypothetical protein
MTDLLLSIDDDQADRIFVDLLYNCYWEYKGDLSFAEDSEKITNACKVLLRQYMVPSEYREEFEDD